MTRRPHRVGGRVRNRRKRDDEDLATVAKTPPQTSPERRRRPNRIVEEPVEPDPLHEAAGALAEVPRISWMSPDDLDAALGGFLAKWCVLGDMETTEVEDFHDAFTLWCHGKGLPLALRPQIVRALRRLGMTRCRIPRGEPNHREGWRGFRLRR